MGEELREWFSGHIKDKWHVLALLAWMIWQMAGYKTSLETHLTGIDDRLDRQGQAIQWLIRHNAPSKDGEPVPMLPMNSHQRSQNYLPDISSYSAPQTADNSAAFTAATR